jgi:hypothetical protein
MKLLRKSESMLQTLTVQAGRLQSPCRRPVFKPKNHATGLGISPLAACPFQSVWGRL